MYYELKNHDKRLRNVMFIPGLSSLGLTSIQTLPVKGIHVGD